MLDAVWDAVRGFLGFGPMRRPNDDLADLCLAFEAVIRAQLDIAREELRDEPAAKALLDDIGTRFGALGDGATKFSDNYGLKLAIHETQRALVDRLARLIAFDAAVTLAYPPSRIEGRRWLIKERFDRVKANRLSRYWWLDGGTDSDAPRAVGVSPRGAAGAGARASLAEAALPPLRHAIDAEAAAEAAAATTAAVVAALRAADDAQRALDTAPADDAVAIAAATARRDAAAQQRDAAAATLQPPAAAGPTLAAEITRRDEAAKLALQDAAKRRAEAQAAFAQAAAGVADDKPLEIGSMLTYIGNNYLMGLSRELAIRDLKRSIRHYFVGKSALLIFAVPALAVLSAWLIWGAGSLFGVMPDGFGAWFDRSLLQHDLAFAFLAVVAGCVLAMAGATVSIARRLQGAVRLNPLDQDVVKELVAFRVGHQGIRLALFLSAIFSLVLLCLVLSGVPAAAGLGGETPGLFPRPAEGWLSSRRRDAKAAAYDARAARVAKEEELRGAGVTCPAAVPPGAASVQPPLTAARTQAVPPATPASDAAAPAPPPARSTPAPGTGTSTASSPTATPDRPQQTVLPSASCAALANLRKAEAQAEAAAAVDLSGPAADAALTARNDVSGLFGRTAGALGLREGGDLAAFFLWCFIVGFAERLVPDVLDRLAKRSGGSRSD